MREFLPLTQIEQTSGDFDIIRDYKAFEGLCLRKKLRSKIYPLDQNYTVLMYEGYPQFNNNYQTVLNDIKGPEILFLGGGINLLAKAISLEGFTIDCIEIESDIINLMDSAIFNNLIHADAETYEPNKMYDCIVMDIFLNKGENYQQRKDNLKNTYQNFLKNDGVYLEINF